MIVPVGLAEADCPFAEVAVDMANDHADTSMGLCPRSGRLENVAALAGPTIIVNCDGDEHNRGIAYVNFLWCRDVVCSLGVMRCRMQYYGELYSSCYGRFRKGQPDMMKEYMGWP